MRPGDIQTIPELIDYCREALALHPEHMSKKEQESPAGHLVALYCNDLCHDEWEVKYPQIVEMLDIAADLEWSNVEDHKASWQRIIRLVDELEREVNKASRPL